MSQQLAQEGVVADLMEMMENIALNAGYPRYFENQQVFCDANTYFDICHRIFSDLRIRIIKIAEYQDQSPGLRLQQLIDLLANELKVDMRGIRGDQIINNNIAHIHRFLEILHHQSNIFIQSRNLRVIVRSESARKRDNRNNDRPVINSAREPARKYLTNENSSSHDLEEGKVGMDPQPMQKKAKKQQKPGQMMKRKQKKREIQYSADKKRARSFKQEKANLHSSLVYTIMKEKTKIMKAANRDNRKNKMGDVQQSKEAYKAYLKRYTKQNGADLRRAASLQAKAAPKTVSQQLPIRDFERIDCFFESFARKFRDRKSVYLRKMKQLVRRQELDRYCFQHRIQKEAKNYLEKRLHSQILALNHQNKVKKGLQGQEAAALENKLSIMRKDQREASSKHQRELKQAKRRELQQIQNVLREENERVLMGLEEGGRLEQIILKMYKKF